MCFDGLSLAVLKENDLEYQITLPWQTWAFISLRKSCFLQKQTLMKNLLSVERVGVCIPVVFPLLRFYCYLPNIAPGVWTRGMDLWKHRFTLQLSQQLLVFYQK